MGTGLTVERWVVKEKEGTSMYTGASGIKLFYELTVGGFWRVQGGQGGISSLDTEFPGRSAQLSYVPQYCTRITRIRGPEAKKAGAKGARWKDEKGRGQRDLRV